ncbi:Translation initiation factor 2 subunit alpha [uncultured archaeon]|nr:Translation initiation factor 2 subunit alpha [uncultured archaeon]
MANKTTPDIDELVIVTVKKIFPYGAFCQMEEYNRECFLHVSEVSSGWVKNIRNFLKEGQRVVVRIYRLVPEKNMIDVSLKRVSDADTKRKLEGFKRDKRVSKLLEVAQSKMKTKPTMTIAEVSQKMVVEFGDAFSGFEVAASDGESALTKIGITSDWAAAITAIAKDNIKKQVRRITGILTLQCTGEDGINVIKSLLAIDGAEVAYLGAPNYLLAVEGDDFKKCEKKMKTIVDSVTKTAEKKDCSVKFERNE